MVEVSPFNTATSIDRCTLLELIARVLPSAQPASWHRLLDTARVKTFAKGDLLSHQGGSFEATIILRGIAGFRRTTLAGQQILVGTAEPGDLFGITSIAAVRSSVSIVALTDCEVAVWPGAVLRRLAGEDAGVALDIIDRLSVSLAILTEKVDGFLHQDARRRVIRILARHQNLFFGQPPILSRGYLPELIGTTREQTGRVLRDLEREGIVERVGRTGLRVLRPDQLAAEPLPSLD